MINHLHRKGTKSHVSCQQDCAIFDSVASSHFLLLIAPVTDKTIADTPLTVTPPNGDVVSPSHIAKLNLPQLLHTVRAYGACPTWIGITFPGVSREVM